MDDIRQYISTLLPCDFTLTESSTVSYTLDNYSIHLVLRSADGCKFDWHTVITVAIHEAAHVLDKHAISTHGDSFYAHRDRLTERARQLYGYDPSYPIDPSYPTHTCD